MKEIFTLFNKFRATTRVGSDDSVTMIVIK